jgi:hypothetical protein
MNDQSSLNRYFSILLFIEKPIHPHVQEEGPSLFATVDGAVDVYNRGDVHVQIDIH